MASFFDKLKGVFGIKTKTIDSGEKAVHPATYDADAKKVKRINFTDEIQKIYETWMNDTYDSSDTVKNRFERYKDLEHMYYNSTIMSTATELYADEAVQIEAEAFPIEVSAPDSEVTKYVNEFFERIGVTTELLRVAAFDLALYADHPWITPMNPEVGYTEIVPTDVKNLIDRIEFNAAEAQSKMKGKKYHQLVAKHKRLQILADLMNNSKEDYSQYFKSFLFGFQLAGDIYLPPWNLQHFRRFSAHSEFHPFGRPLFINSIAPYRQLQSAKNLMALARAMNFPIQHFEVEVPDTMDEMQVWEAVKDARAEYQNLGNMATGKEQYAVNGQIWTPAGKIKINTIDPSLNLDNIADVEMLREDLILGTRIPKGYLIVDRGWGVSGQSLLQQSKLFARAVLTIQTAILEVLAQMTRTQMEVMGKFDGFKTEFELSMTFPVIEETRDRMSAKSDSLRLAKDVIDNLGDYMGLDRGESLPSDVVKNVLSQLSFLDAEDVDKWVDEIKDEQEKAQQVEPDTGNDFSKGNFGMSFENEKQTPLRDETDRLNRIREKARRMLNEDVINRMYFDSKKKLGLREGVMNRKHYYVSNANINPQQKMILEVCKQHRIGGDKLKG